MKKLLLASLVAGLSISAAQAAPKVYGRINASLDNVSVKTGTATAVTTNSLDSNSSRFGLKGEDELTPSVSAVYQVEWAFAADQQDTTGLEKITQRNRFIGLKHNDLGTVKFGKYDSYTKLAQGEIDQFNDYVAEKVDMKQTFAGENRIENVIGYESPIWLGGLQVNTMFKAGENAGQSNDCAPTTTYPNTCANTGHGATTGGSSSSVTYKNEDMGVYAALAADRHLASTFNGYSSTAINADLIRLVGSYNFKAVGLDALTINGLYQTAKPSQDQFKAANNQLDNEKAYLLSAAYKLPEIAGYDGFLVKAQYQKAITNYKGSAASPDNNIHQIGFGLDYNYSPKTRVYTFYAKRKDNKLGVAANELTSTYFGLGMDHKF